MANRARIAITGNCQAQTLTSLAITLGLPVDPIVLPPVFDRPSFDNEDIRRAIEGCDYVFNQLVSDNFPVEFARPSAVKAAFGTRSFAWPNIYFDGYFPTVGYMYAKDGTKVTGPLSDYHFTPVVQAWAAGRDATQTWIEINDGRAQGLPQSPVEDALGRLKARELRSDLRISDFLADRFRHKPLFYSMNHPSNEVIIEMLRRMMTSIGVSLPTVREVDLAMKDFQYTLDKIRLPYFQYIRDRYIIPKTHGDSIIGCSLREENGIVIEGLNSVAYEGPDLVEAYYRVYDSCCDRDEIQSLA